MAAVACNLEHIVNERINNQMWTCNTIKSETIHANKIEAHTENDNFVFRGVGLFPHPKLNRHITIQLQNLM